MQIGAKSSKKTAKEVNKEKCISSRSVHKIKTKRAINPNRNKVIDLVKRIQALTARVFEPVARSPSMSSMSFTNSRVSVVKKAKSA